MANENKTRDCPYCKEEIKVDAIKCKHCGSSVTPEKPSHKGTCPYCKETIHPEAIKCKHCQSYLIIVPLSADESAFVRTCLSSRFLGALGGIIAKAQV